MYLLPFLLSSHLLVWSITNIFAFRKKSSFYLVVDMGGPTGLPCPKDLRKNGPLLYRGVKRIYIKV
jgi:hypothetical protein